MLRLSRGTGKPRPVLGAGLLELSGLEHLDFYIKPCETANVVRLAVEAVGAHPHAQGAYARVPLEPFSPTSSSPRAGSLHFLTRHHASRQPEKYSASLY